MWLVSSLLSRCFSLRQSTLIELNFILIDSKGSEREKDVTSVKCWDMESCLVGSAPAMFLLIIIVFEDTVLVFDLFIYDYLSVMVRVPHDCDQDYHHHNLDNVLPLSIILLSLSPLYYIFSIFILSLSGTCAQLCEMLRLKKTQTHAESKRMKRWKHKVCVSRTIFASPKCLRCPCVHCFRVALPSCSLLDKCRRREKIWVVCVLLIGCQLDEGRGGQWTMIEAGWRSTRGWLKKTCRDTSHH